VKKNACPRRPAFNSFLVYRTPEDEEEDAAEAAANAAAVAAAPAPGAAPSRHDSRAGRKPPTIRPSPN
jgi:hypothetical protein